MKIFKSLKEEYLQEGVYDPGIFKAYFLAGGPGSGKTYVTRKVTGGLGLKNVNSLILDKLNSFIGCLFLFGKNKAYKIGIVILGRPS